eukprot:JP448216.1.p2 GENE.JP448216.1~~JP448216.1.p2  ORF type:complete len:106 (+),score=14.99 JP448216.1:83-400(+)
MHWKPNHATRAFLQGCLYRLPSSPAAVDDFFHSPATSFGIFADLARPDVRAVIRGNEYVATLIENLEEVTVFWVEQRKRGRMPSPRAMAKLAGMFNRVKSIEIVS